MFLRIWVEGSVSDPPYPTQSLNALHLPSTFGIKSLVSNFRRRHRDGKVEPATPITNALQRHPLFSTDEKSVDGSTAYDVFGAVLPNDSELGIHKLE